MPLPLAPTLASLTVPGEDLRAALAKLADLRFRAVQLSAAIPSLRPRDLDRSARRDLLARLRRLELQPAGIDLWIPPEHLTDPLHADRAASALLDAVALAGDLGRIPLSIDLPEPAPVDLLDALESRADAAGVPLADFGAHGARLGVGIDPATLLLAGKNPAGEASAADRLNSARYSDADRHGRVAPGTGRLSLVEYQVALVTRGYSAAVALDLRGVSRPWDAAAVSAERWRATGLVDPIEAP